MGFYHTFEIEEDTIEASSNYINLDIEVLPRTGPFGIPGYIFSFLGWFFGSVFTLPWIIKYIGPWIKDKFLLSIVPASVVKKGISKYLNTFKLFSLTLFQQIIIC